MSKTTPSQPTPAEQGQSVPKAILYSWGTSVWVSRTKGPCPLWGVVGSVMGCVRRKRWPVEKKQEWTVEREVSSVDRTEEDHTRPIMDFVHQRGVVCYCYHHDLGYGLSLEDDSKRALTPSSLSSSSSPFSFAILILAHAPSSTSSSPYPPLCIPVSRRTSSNHRPTDSTPRTQTRKTKFNAY